MSIVWQDPPAPKPRKVDVVAAELRAKPGEWAMIDSGPTQLLPWWQALANDPAYEYRIQRLDNQLFGRREIYARYIAEGTTTRTEGSLAELRALSEAATPGPWEDSAFADGSVSIDRISDGDDDDGAEVATLTGTADAAFIVAAVNHVRRILRGEW